MIPWLNTILLFLVALAITVLAYRWAYPRKRILTPTDNRPFTSDELRRMGIVLPDPIAYDCETFIR